MPQLGTVALPAAGLQFLELKIAGRFLNTAGVAFLAGAIALLTSVCLPVFERTVLGLVLATVIIGCGDVLSRRSKSTWWFGSSTLASGYALAAFFAHASYYVGGLPKLSIPYPCWLLELTLAAMAVLHARKNIVLRWLAVPFTLCLSADVFMHALASNDAMTVLGYTINVSAAASIIGVLYLAGLCALYKKLELQLSSSDGSKQDLPAKLMYRVAHETYFLLAAFNALCLPWFLDSLQYAPLWWAVETPILLAICWRSSSFIKHGMIMAIWIVSAVLLLLNTMQLDMLVKMALPASGIVMALAYRYLQSSWGRWQKFTGYAVYLYGAVAMAIVLPFLQLGVVEALPYFLLEAALLVVMSLVLSDRIIQTVATVLALASLLLFAARINEWQLPLCSLVVLGCYATSLLYGYVKKKGGWPKSEFVPSGGTLTVSAKEAQWLEYESGLAGYLTLMLSSILLISNPENTIAWGVEAFSLIAFGFLTNKVGHRFSGLLAIGFASVKLTIFDLSGAGTLVRSLVSFGAVGVCCFAAGIFYEVEYGRKKRRASAAELKLKQ